jgi:hypothetical protein
MIDNVIFDRFVWEKQSLFLRETPLNNRGLSVKFWDFFSRILELFLYWIFCGLVTRSRSTIDLRRRWWRDSLETDAQATEVVETSLQGFRKWKLIHHRECYCVEGWWTWTDGERELRWWVKLWWCGTPAREAVKWRQGWVVGRVRELGMTFL